jgi:hypothetical protein
MPECRCLAAVSYFALLSEGIRRDLAVPLSFTSSTGAARESVRGSFAAQARAAPFIFKGLLLHVSCRSMPDVFATGYGCGMEVAWGADLGQFGARQCKAVGDKGLGRAGGMARGGTKCRTLVPILTVPFWHTPHGQGVPICNGGGTARGGGRGPRAARGVLRQGACHGRPARARRGPTPVRGPEFMVYLCRKIYRVSNATHMV